MKGLLLKDWYMMKTYCRMYLVLTAVFMAASFVNGSNLFFVFYPCLMCGMIPVTLLAYDERSRWMQYSGTLPYTRAQLVSAKYLIGLLIQLAVLAATAVGQGIRSGFTPDFGILMLAMLTIATLASAIPLPFVFKLGVEKGRTAYYVMIVFVCGASALASKNLNGEALAQLPSQWLLPAIALAGVCIYALSWLLSIRFYQKREC